MSDEKAQLSDRRHPEHDAALRPQILADCVGQEAARKNLKVFIESAKARGEALDHVLFDGPPGLGQTTLAQIVARELGVNFRSTSGPEIAEAGDLAVHLTNLDPRDVLFIDEIHRLNPAVEEMLYLAMKDFQLDLIIGDGAAARSVKIDLARFTLIGATTSAGLLTNSLRDRFDIPIRLDFHTTEEKKITPVQWVEGVCILIVSGLIVIVPLSWLGAVLHVHFIIVGGIALVAPVAFGIQRLLSKYGLSTLD